MYHRSDEFDEGLFFPSQEFFIIIINFKHGGHLLSFCNKFL